MLGIHQDGGIDVCQMMRKNRQKNCGVRQNEYELQTPYNFVSGDRIQFFFFFFDQKEINMSLSVQRSVAESFKFNGKKVRSVHVKGEECLFTKDVFKAIEYDRENGIKAIQRLVQEKYKCDWETLR